jgi:hypothetical protein
MSGESDHEKLLNEIIDIELRMFLAVLSASPSACQEQPDALRLMRRGSFCVLSAETLESYLSDLQEALEEGTNLMEMKYARIDDLVPPLSTSPFIDEIVDIESGWMKDLAGKYPLAFKGRAEYSAGIYLRSELETYSDRTLELYFGDVSRAAAEGRNLTEERYTFIFKQIGFDSIDAMERERQQAG